MPAYVVKVTSTEGFIKPPVVANCKDEKEAIRLVRAIVDVLDDVKIAGTELEEMKGPFGNLPPGAAQFRLDWGWSEDGETPESR